MLRAKTIQGLVAPNATAVSGTLALAMVAPQSVQLLGSAEYQWANISAVLVMVGLLTLRTIPRVASPC